MQGRTACVRAALQPGLPQRESSALLLPPLSLNQPIARSH
jgi:hypothetical protein